VSTPDGNRGTWTVSTWTALKYRGSASVASSSSAGLTPKFCTDMVEVITGFAASRSTPVWPRASEP
jgi:hypothetical protein